MNCKQGKNIAVLPGICLWSSKAREKKIFPEQSKGYPQGMESEGRRWVMVDGAKA